MKPTNSANSIQLRRKIALSLGLFLLALYLLIYRGGFHSVDEVSMFAVTESLAKFGRVDTNQIAWTQWTTTQAEAQGFFGRDGSVYSKKGLALSLAQAPLYLVAMLLPGLGMLQTVSLLNAAVTALTGLLVFMFLWRMDFSPGVSAVSALLYGAATIAFVYAKYLFSEPLAAFLLLLAAYMLFAYRQEGGLRHIAIAGLAAGLAVVARANNLFLLPVFGLYLLWVVSRGADLSLDTRHSSLVNRNLQSAIRSVTPPLTAFILSLAIPGLILLGYNALRSGNPLQTGYDLTLFSPNILLGLYKLLFSPLRGFFIYSPLLLLSLPGWWLLRRRFPAEAWLFAGLVGVTVLLFSAWSSGEGLSWGSRFLVPVTPFFALCLAPIVARVQRSKGAEAQGAGENTQHATRNTHSVLRFTFYVLLPLSLLIQLLGAIINPWVFLAQLQTEFGGEFFLEKTDALYDFRTSQIVGQLQTFAVQNSDLAWWQPWGFDAVAFGASLALVVLTGGLLWRTVTRAQGAGEKSPLLLRTPAPLLVVLIAATLFLLHRYNRTDLQFGPPGDGYTSALNQIAAADSFGSPIVTVAPYHYHVPMNRFKGRHPLIGFARQSWPPPAAAEALLTAAAQTPNAWLVTVGFPPAAADNAAEQWLARHTAKISDDWGDHDTRLVRFTASPPTETRPVATLLGDAIRLDSAALQNPANPGDALPVELAFSALNQPAADLTVFVQLLSIDGGVIAQTNSPPVGGYEPTSRWQPGQSIASRHGLLIPPDAPPGDYRLICGLFNPVTGQRLPAASGSDFVDLGVVTIVD